MAPGPRRLGKPDRDLESDGLLPAVRIGFEWTDHAMNVCLRQKANGGEVHPEEKAGREGRWGVKGAGREGRWGEQTRIGRATKSAIMFGDAT
jgi:hypothetical protein